MDLTRELAARRPPPEEDASWRPVLIDAADREALAALLRAGRVERVHDTIADQLRERVASLYPARRLAGPALDAAVAEHLGGTPPDAYGTWVFYPWSRRLVHALPEAELRHLRGDRNRYKITPAEQARLHARRIGVVGLSVGRGAAFTLAQEGVGGHFVLADFDTLALSNMNRLRGGLHDLGVPKTVLAARELFELDPYLDVELLQEGLRPDNVDAFLEGRGRLDLVVEECDDLYVKVKVRERARALGIPVVMETSDRGLLDVERFDLEPDRPVFHGLIGDVGAETLRGLSTRDKIPYVLRILDPEALSMRARASMLEIDESISTWPQLASGVALGGAVVTDVARRILLGQMTRSGRFSVDLERLVSDETARSPDAPVESVRAEAPAALPPLAAADPRALVPALVARGVLAPSVGNGQPWRFVFADGRLQCRLDPERARRALDPDDVTGRLAVGAAVENIALAAASAGLRVECRPVEHLCDLTFAPGAVDDPALAAQIERRATCRAAGPRRPIPAGDLAALAAAAAGARLDFATSPEDLAELGALMADADRVSLLDPRLHADVMAEFRWSRAEAEATRDGLDVGGMGLSPVDLAGLRILSDPAIVGFLGAQGRGAGLGALTRRSVAGAGAIGLLSVPDPADAFAGGRAMQRMWLEATARGLGVHPMSALPYTLAHDARDPGFFAPETRALLADVRARFLRVFPAAERTWLLLFRLLVADSPPPRSLRRPVEAVLRFA